MCDDVSLRMEASNTIIMWLHESLKRLRPDYCEESYNICIVKKKIIME